MACSKIGEALFRARPASSPILSFLVPSVSPALLARTHFITQTTTHTIRRRWLATPTYPRQASATSSLKGDEPSDTSDPSSNDPTQTLPGDHAAKAAKADADQIEDILSSLVIKDRSTGQRPQYESPSARNQNRRVIDSKRGESPIVQRQNALASAMFPDEQQIMLGSMVSQDISKTSVAPLPPPLRLDAFVGRSEEVDNSKGQDLGTALRRLNQKLRHNAVRYDQQQQRFHERPGLKRKRLKSERWRKNFKLGFQATLNKVLKMKNQGW